MDVPFNDHPPSRIVIRGVVRVRPEPVLDAGRAGRETWFIVGIGFVFGCVGYAMVV
jgi:hypothetical protein